MTFTRGNRGKAWLHGAVALVGLMGVVAGCASAGRELSREEARRQAAWDALVAPGRRPAVATLGWTAALEQMRRHNGKIREADLNVTRAAEALDQVKRSLIPTANFSAGYEHLFDSGNLGIEPFTFAASLFFDVPGLFNFRVRCEAAVLTLAHARLVRETVWRQQVIALYRANLEGGDLARHADRLARSQSALAELAAAAPDTAARERGSLAREQRDLARLQNDWRQRTGEILGLPGVPVVLSADGLPALPYALPSNRPGPERLARLPLRLAALDLLALRARRLGITLQEWPEVEMSMSSPTVFETGSGGTYDVWSPRQVFVSVNSFWALDTQGKHASDRRLLDGEMAYRREVLEQEAAATAAKLRQALDGLARTDRRLDLVEHALAASEASRKPELNQAKEDLMADRRDWRLTIWFFDDAQWPKDST